MLIVVVSPVFIAKRMAGCLSGHDGWFALMASWIFMSLFFRLTGFAGGKAMLNAKTDAIRIVGVQNMLLTMARFTETSLGCGIFHNKESLVPVLTYW